MSIFYRFGEVAKGYEKIFCILIMALNRDSVSRYVLIVYRVNYDKRGGLHPGLWKRAKHGFGKLISLKEHL
jgi:hypothetical protein